MPYRETDIEIRPCGEGDGAEVAALWRRVFGYDTRHNRPELVVQAKLAYQSNLFFVAVHDGQIVGTVLGGYDGHRGWIYSLAVIPEFRGRGAGVALVQRAEQELQALGCVKINLQVRSDNEAVVEFYRRLGYSVEDRISMGKVVSS